MGASYIYDISHLRIKDILSSQSCGCNIVCCCHVADPFWRFDIENRELKVVMFVRLCT